MKTLITATALALVSNFAVAEVFTYERQIGSQDLDPAIYHSVSNVTNPLPSARHYRLSLNDFYRGNPDVANVPFHVSEEIYIGDNVLESTSYDAWVRGNPDVDSGV